MERTLSVAVIDDNRDECQTLADILEEFACDVTCCWEAKEALSLCNSRPFDLIVLDLKMPGVSGLDILSGIQPKRHGCIVVATGLQDETLRRECLDAGADEVLLKPLDIPRLREMADEIRATGDCRQGAATPA